MSSSVSDIPLPTNTSPTSGVPAEVDPTEARRLQLRRFRENRLLFPSAQLVDHIGKWIAWNRDGTAIVAGGERPNDLQAALVAQGLTFQDVICEQIGHPDDFE